jgi:hypothetical protein
VDAFILGLLDVVEGPLLLGNIGVCNIKGPFTLGHLQAQLESELLLRQILNGSHSLLIIE